MAERTRCVPDGYHNVNPYIVVTDVEGLVDFLREVLGGVERSEREISTDGTIGHAEVEIGEGHRVRARGWPLCCSVLLETVGWSCGIDLSNGRGTRCMHA